MMQNVFRFYSGLLFLLQIIFTKFVLVFPATKHFHRAAGKKSHITKPSERLEHRNAKDAKKQTHFEMLTETLFWLVYVKQCPNGVNSNDPLRLSILLKLHHVNPS